MIEGCCVSLYYIEKLKIMVCLHMTQDFFNMGFHPTCWVTKAIH
jgi:hypothetical protein